MMGQALPSSDALEYSIETINVAVWAAIGAAIGWIATQLKHTKDRIVFLENIGVAAFGSFIGGEFVSAMIRTGPKQAGFTLIAIGLAVACSALALVLLGLMRRSVGPLRSGKAKRQR